MTETAAPASPPAAGRACPRCGASLAPDQEWCLSCGNAVGTRIAPTPRWRVPVALVGGLLALVAVALVLALVELAGDPQPVAEAPSATPTVTPAPATPPQESGTPSAPVAGATPTPSATATPGTTPDPGAGAGGLATWPEGEAAWTVVLASTRDRAEAEEKARAAGGADVGVLRSNDFSSLRRGYWVVFQGQYDSRSAAEDAAEGAAGDAYARRVVPR